MLYRFLSCLTVMPHFSISQDELAVNLVVKLLQLIPGKVHTEVDIRDLYSKQKSLERARRLMAMYKDMGAPKNEW